MCTQKLPTSRNNTGKIPRYLAEASGQCADKIRKFDWSNHVLGPIELWPRALQSTLATILRSRQAMFLFWGPQHVCFYNDMYMRTMGQANQTRGIGCFAETLWHEVWDNIAPKIEATMLRAESSWNEDQLFISTRDDTLSATYWTYSYTPVFDDEGTVGGALVICTETTKQVLSARRLRILQQLSSKLIRCRTPKEVVGVLVCTLAEHHDDIAQVIFTRLEDVDYLPTYAASVPHQTTHEPNSGQAKVHESKIVGSAPHIHIGLLHFEIPMQNILDRAYIEFFNQITDRVGVAIENMRTRMQGDIFFNLPHRMLCIASQSGYLTRVSPGFVQALGFDTEHLLSVPFTDFVHPDDLESTIAVTKQLGDQQPVVNFTNRYRCHNGNYRWLSWVAQPRGGLIYCVVHDITQLKNAEEKLLKALDARDAFLGIASHELKTPITSLKLYSQMIERQYNKQGLSYFNKDRIERVMRMLLTQSERLGRLVEDMLDISRITAGRLAMRTKQASLTSLVADVVSHFDLQIKAAASTVHVKLQPGIVGRFDVFRIEQVLSNLITNALRYAPGEPITIDLERDADQAVLRVADTGPGISAACRDRIFERFERFVSPNEVSGLGLGLYISQQIVAAHHGSIRLDTTAGQGACFEVRLPLDNGPSPRP